MVCLFYAFQTSFIWLSCLGCVSNFSSCAFWDENLIRCWLKCMLALQKKKPSFLYIWMLIAWLKSIILVYDILLCSLLWNQECFFTYLIQFHLLALQFCLCILAKCKLGQFCSFKNVYSGVAKKKSVQDYFANKCTFLLKHKMLKFVFKISPNMAPTCFGPFGPSSGSIQWNLAKVTVSLKSSVKTHR